MAKISVIGTGYLGLTHAASMASLGHDVIALDIDEQKVAILAQGTVPFHEPGLPELVQQALQSGKLSFTTSWQEVAQNADVHFLCVGTPQAADSGAADLSQVFGAVNALAPYLNEPNVVVGKSTVPVGTAAQVAELLATTSPAGTASHLIWNPEFLREGFAVQDTLHPDRIVLGLTHQEDVEVLSDVYAQPLAEGTPLVVTDYSTAELVKVAANAFLATKISFINAFADLCDATGADVTTLADAIGYDTRIGRRFLNAGVGFGGGCLPKDIRALHARATELGLEKQFAFLHQADTINLSRRTHVVSKATALLGGSVAGKRIAILGAAFKPDSDDIRDSPALSIALLLKDAGADVIVHDPEAVENVKVRYPQLATATDSTVALNQAELVLHLTEWNEYRQLDPGVLRTIVRTPMILDGRNILDARLWSQAGWSITYLGKPSVSNAQ